jgi:CheY-like chemotaxis protein
VQERSSTKPTTRVAQAVREKTRVVTPYRLLVADDDRAFRALLVAALRVDGYEIVEVATGLELQDALVTPPPAADGHAFDLVISDVRMPGLSGIDALARLGRSPMAPPVLFITAFADDEVHEQARRAGAVDVLDKPLDVDDLRAFVAEFLAGRADRRPRSG